MKKIEVDRLIIKLIDNTISDEESEILVAWLEEAENRIYFNEFIKVNQLINQNKKFDQQYSLKQHTLKSKKRNRNRKTVLYVAASIIALIAIGITFTKNSLETKSSIPVIVNNNIEPGTSKATLILENGKEIVFEKGNSLVTQNAISNGEEIIYKKNSTVKNVVYNILTVPRGGQFLLQLTDGTKVWMNSETQLKYPVNFIEGKPRQVELLYGEAYFDVSHGTKQNGTLFRVVNVNQEVQVYGTEFNIKAYKDEMNILTTLVEGKIAINYNGKQQYLIPNQKSDFNLKTQQLTVSKVNVNKEISWKKGVFDFDAEKLSHIMKVLSRWYDMNVDFQIKELKEQKFTGLLNKAYSIEETLAVMKNANVINNYEIRDKTIILK